MDNLNLISNFAEFKELKNIDKSTMIGVLEDVFRHLLIKTYETDENFDIIINADKGDLEIWRNRIIVEDGQVENPNQQISISDARKLDETYEVGEEVADEIKLDSFGRRAVLSLRQNLASRILDLEKANLFEKYSERVGEIITGEVYQVWKKEILVLDDEDNELILPKSEQIPSDFFRKGDTIRAIATTARSSSSPARHPNSSKGSSNRRCRRYSTASSPSRKSSAYRANGPRWPWNPTTNASTRWAHASV